ncbi:hypothetical protein GGG16DRAFT_119994 [Schizophyllum commune]
MQKNASVKSNGKDKHHKAGAFGIFKSKSSHNLQPGEPDAPRTSMDPSSGEAQQVFSLLDTLKNQHATLSKLLTVTVSLDTTLPKTSEEDEEQLVDSPRETEHWVVPHGRTKRFSSSTTASSSLEWFDAEDDADGAEEFVLDTRTAGDESQPSQITMEAEDEDTARSSMDTDIEDEPARKSSAEAPLGQQAVVHRHRRGLTDGMYNYNNDAKSNEVGWTSTKPAKPPSLLASTPSSSNSSTCTRGYMASLDEMMRSAPDARALMGITYLKKRYPRFGVEKRKAPARATKGLPATRR